LVDILPLGSESMDPYIFADPDPGSQNLADPTDPDPKHRTKHQLSKSTIQVGLAELVPVNQFLGRFRINYPPICKLPTFNATNPWVSRKPREKAWQPKLARNVLD